MSTSTARFARRGARDANGRVVLGAAGRRAADAEVSRDEFRGTLPAQQARVGFVVPTDRAAAKTCHPAGPTTARHGRHRPRADHQSWSAKERRCTAGASPRYPTDAEAFSRPLVKQSGEWIVSPRGNPFTSRSSRPTPRRATRRAPKVVIEMTAYPGRTARAGVIRKCSAPRREGSGPQDGHRPVDCRTFRRSRAGATRDRTFDTRERTSPDDIPTRSSHDRRTRRRKRRRDRLRSSLRATGSGRAQRGVRTSWRRSADGSRGAPQQRAQQSTSGTNPELQGSCPGSVLAPGKPCRACKSG